MSWSSAAWAKGVPLKLLSPRRSPWKPSAAKRGSIADAPARSSTLAGVHSRSSSEPCLSHKACSFTPLISLPPSMPRAKQLGAERCERLSTTTAEGSTSSPQAKRQSKARRCPSRRHSPSRVQREGTVKGREWHAREDPSDAPLHAGEGQHPDQPENAPAQIRIWLAAAPVRAGALAVHGFQFGLCGIDEDLNLGERVPSIARLRPGDASGGVGNHITGAWVVGWSKRQRW